MPTLSIVGLSKVLRGTHEVATQTHSGSGDPAIAVGPGDQQIYGMRRVFVICLDSFLDLEVDQWQFVVRTDC